MAAGAPPTAVQGGTEAEVTTTASLAGAPRVKTNPNQKQKQKQFCRFFNSKNGCRAGNACPFVHASPPKAAVPEAQLQSSNPEGGRGESRAAGDQRRHELPPVQKAKVVSRPIPVSEQKDPREFQVGQIRRRFAPTEESVEQGTLFKLRLAPSDPDFPFDLPFLECSLTVPLSYPKASSSLRVTNQEMPRGFQLNVERGFDQIVTQNVTLLGAFNRLDKQLETLLSGEKAETVKIVRNAHQTRLPSLPQPQPQPLTEAPKSRQVPRLIESFSLEQKSQAQQKRQSDVRQLVARLGRLPGFNQSSDGVTFTLPFQPLKKTALPRGLQSQKSIRLIVPELYNLHLPRIEVNGNDDPAARALEQSFQERVKHEASLNLLAHINYMTQNAHTMSVPKESPILQPVAQAPENVVKSDIVVPIPVASANTAIAEQSDKPHVQIIPRPPEWSNQSADDSSSDDSYSYDSGDETEEEMLEKPEENSTQTSGMAERGIMLSFPNLEMYGCELLELISLNITVKCERCKDLLDVQRLKNNSKGDATGMRDEICKKCANNLAVGFRADLLHQNSVRAGYLDLDGCTVVDMLPSNFMPTCSECSTSYPTPGVVGVRGDSVMAICRECHRKMSFRIPETKFLQVSASAVRASRAPTRRKVKEHLGIVAGQELPRRGRCTHYAKSYRWFRFSCCSKVYPCDRCHDEKESHPNEHANRMICGYCSREQNYHPEHCHFCRASLIARRGRGFWEGGKGTRDQLRMSRKDPRKYKRRPGTKPSGN